MGMPSFRGLPHRCISPQFADAMREAQTQTWSTGLSSLRRCILGQKCPGRRGRGEAARRKVWLAGGGLRIVGNSIYGTKHSRKIVRGVWEPNIRHVACGFAWCLVTCGRWRWSLRIM